MGACTSVQKDPDSATRNRQGLAHKAKRFLIPSPSKERPLSVEKPVAQDGLKTTEFGSKEETFLDTRACLDSDCEDDFFSVDGEFTPSRCSTPKHQMSAPSTFQLDNHFILDKRPVSNSEPSTTGRKKLVDLLHEKSQSEQNAAGADVKSDVNKAIDTSPGPALYDCHCRC